MSDFFWIGLMASRTLLHSDDKSISRELKLIFGDDFIGYRAVCNEQISASGEYFLFVNCSNYQEHKEALNHCHFITGVIPSRDEPYHFSLKEISGFLVSSEKTVETGACLNNGDVVLIKTGYLKGLYGIVIKELTRKKVKVFFSFYVRQFFESFGVTSLEFIGRVSGFEFPNETVGKPIVIGAHVVHHSKLHRSEGRKHKTGDRRRRRRSSVL